MNNNIAEFTSRQVMNSVKYIIEVKTYNLKPNDILLTNNNELHKPVIENGMNYERIVIYN